METIRQRLVNLAKEKYGMTISSFAETCDIPKSALSVSKITLRSDTIEKILLSHPEIDAYWLITGKTIDGKDVDMISVTTIKELDKRVTEIEYMLNIR